MSLFKTFMSILAAISVIGLASMLTIIEFLRQELPRMIDRKLARR